MAKKINILIPSLLCDKFERFITFNSSRTYELFSCGTPLLQRYRMDKQDLLGTVIDIQYNYEIKCSEEYRARLLFYIARDLLDPITIIEP